MRHPRIKPQEDTFVHVYNRTTGSSADRPFGPAEKTEFIRRLKRLSLLYVIEPVAFQAMGNIFTCFCSSPERPRATRRLPSGTAGSTA
jgi:hypothetical protein